MTDKFSKEKRSEIMSKIAGKETTPEILIRRFLFSNGYRFRKNVKTLPGKPDIVMPKYKIIIFVHGCFWHKHNCKRGDLPQDNANFWSEKINKNVERDNSNISKLKSAGWNIIVIWQCEIKNNVLRESRLKRLLEEIRPAK